MLLSDEKIDGLPTVSDVSGADVLPLQLLFQSLFSVP